MTAPKEKSKTNFYHIPTWLTLANLIFLVSLSFKTGAIKKDIENGIEQNRHEIEQQTQMILRHENNTEVHMPFNQKMEVFVPRKELNVKFEALQRQNNDIKTQLDRIEKKL